MTNPNPQRMLRKWQKRLGLLDWRIEVFFVEPSDLDAGCAANCWWHPDEMHAKVWLQAPEEAQIADHKYFVESHMVHELLHLVIGGHGPVPEYDVNLERSINKLLLAMLPEPKHQV